MNGYGMTGMAPPARVKSAPQTPIMRPMTMPQPNMGMRGQIASAMGQQSMQPMQHPQVGMFRGNRGLAY